MNNHENINGAGIGEDLDAWAIEEAYIAACERMSPNAPDFDDLCEALYQQIIENL